MNETIRVLIVDDHTIVRKGIRALLTEIADIEVVGEAADGQEAIDQADRLRPDVILMDLAMPHMDGIEATRQIKAQQPESRMLVMTSFATDEKVLPAIKAGALGYLLKESAPEELVQAIHQIQPRGIVAASGHRPQSLAGDRPSRRPPPTPDPLTEREVEVLRLVAQGMSNQDHCREFAHQRPHGAHPCEQHYGQAATWRIGCRRRCMPCGRGW